MLHISEDDGILEFAPRLSALAGEPVVWAVDASRLRNYLLPRDCPRVTFYAGPDTSANDIATFLAPHAAVVAIESSTMPSVPWLPEASTCVCCQASGRCTTPSPPRPCSSR